MISKSDCLTRSVMGRVASPSGGSSFRPRNSPAMMRIRVTSGSPRRLPDLPSPFESHRLLDIGAKGFVHRTRMGRVLAAAAVGFAVIVGDADGYGEPANAPLWIGHHFLGDADCRAGDVDIFAL